MAVGSGVKDVLSVHGSDNGPVGFGGVPPRSGLQDQSRSGSRVSTGHGGDAEGDLTVLDERQILNLALYLPVNMFLFFAILSLFSLKTLKEKNRRQIQNQPTVEPEVELN